MVRSSRHRARVRWLPEPDPERKNLQTLFAFAYGMQVGSARRLAHELQRLAQQAQLATMAAGAAIAVAQQNLMECIARSGSAAPQLGSRPEATVGLSGECIRTGLPQFCADTETHPFVDRMHSRSVGVRSIVYVPLFRGVQPAGVLGVFSDKVGHFTAHDLRVLTLLGREVARTLQWEPRPEPVPAISTASAGSAPAFSKPRSMQGAIAAAMAVQQMPSRSPRPPADEPVVAPAVEKAPDQDPGTLSEAEPVNEPAVPKFFVAEERTVPRWIVVLATAVMIIAGIAAAWYVGSRVQVGSEASDSSAASTIDSPGSGLETSPFAKIGSDAPTSAASEVVPPEAMPKVIPPGAAKSAAAASGTVYLESVRTQVAAGHTFVSIHLTGTPKYKARALKSPDRIYVDLFGAKLKGGASSVPVTAAGEVERFRVDGKDSTVRVAMDLKAPCTYLVTVTQDPAVIVVDILPNGN